MTTKKPGDKKSNSRGLHVKVKTAKKRSTSSTRWLARQLNDPYVVKARQEGYRSRAAFKLLEIDAKFHVLTPGMRVVDLGCAPGGWAQVAVAKVGSKGLVIGCDLLPVDAVPGATLIVQDFLADDAPEVLKAMLAQTPPPTGGRQGGGQKQGFDSVAAPLLTSPRKGEELRARGEGLAHLVMSDMASNTTGHGPTDHIRIIHLCEMAYHFAIEILAPGGTFICKVRKGGTEGDLLKHMQRDFTTVKHAKPKSSRADSAESYVVATGFRG